MNWAEAYDYEVGYNALMGKAIEEIADTTCPGQSHASKREPAKSLGAHEINSKARQADGNTERKQAGADGIGKSASQTEKCPGILR